MFRLLAAVVAVAMMAVSGTAALQHVHEFADHDHADHHHAPAAHSHSRALHHDHVSSGADDRQPARLEPCDPGAHVVPVVYTYVSPELDRAPLGVVSGRAVVASAEEAPGCIAPSDVKAHSPPRPTTARLRAPPALHLA